MSLPLLVRAPDALAWIAGLAESRVVFFPQLAPDGGLGYAPVKPGAALSFDGYEPTVLPPGKVFAPAKDVLFEFEHKADGGFSVTPIHDDAPRAIAGVRPCDLKGIFLMDAVNRDGSPDPHYLARREATALIAYACAAPCNERCFCEAVDALDFYDGADVLLTPVGDDELLAEARTPLGESLAASLEGAPCEDVEAARARYHGARPAPFGRQLPGTMGELTEALAQTWDAQLWRDHTAKCLSCGTCNLVCPTCYCFDTHDEVDVSAPGHGRRCRTWDSCMLPDFTEVAGGHNFRADVASRQRHRIKRKFEYLPGRIGDTFCVGCGRCGSQCTVGIDIFDIATDLLTQGGTP